MFFVRGMWETPSSHYHLEGCKGHSHKAHKENVLKVMNSWYFHGICREFQGLASQRIAIAIVAFSNRKFQIATLTAASAEKSPKNRGMKSQIDAFWNRKFQIAMFLPLKQQRQVEGAQTFRNTKSLQFFWGAISNRSVSAFSKIAAFSGRWVSVYVQSVFRLFFPRPFLGMPWFGPNRYLWEFQGATRLGATGPRASERESASQRVSERTSENLWKPLKISENL